MTKNRLNPPMRTGIFWPKFISVSGMEGVSVMDAAYWATRSPVIDPGAAAAAIDKLPANIPALRRASSQLVFHLIKSAGPNGGPPRQGDVSRVLSASSSQETGGRHA